MINPMIAITTSISTRVKPASARRSARRPLVTTRSVIYPLPTTPLSNPHDPRLARGCHAQHFGRRGHPYPAFFHGIVQHRRHARANGSAVNEGGIGLSADQGPDLIGQLQQFKNPGTPAIAGAAAAFATNRA